MDGGAQIEGLDTTAVAVEIGETRVHLVKDCVAGRERLADNEGLRVFHNAANLFSAGDLAHAGAACVVGEENQIACEKGAMRSAEVKQHGVVSGDRNNTHSGDSRCLFARYLSKKLIQRSSPRVCNLLTHSRITQRTSIMKLPAREEEAPDA